jgi:prefoldin subunit 5
VIIRIGGGVVVEPEASRTLEACLARIRQLEEENAHLREAAKTFGDLAERLKRALDAELRRAGHPGARRDRASLDDRAVKDAGPAGLAK